MNKSVITSYSRLCSRFGRRMALVTLTTAALVAGVVHPASAARATPNHTVAAAAEAGVESSAPISIAGATTSLRNLGTYFRSANGICSAGHRYHIQSGSSAELSRVRQTILKGNGAPGAKFRVIPTGATSFELYVYHDLRESYWGFPAGSCIDSKVAPHKGRELRQIPFWALGVLAALAAAAIFLGVGLAAGAAIARYALGRLSAAAVEIISGCVAGAMSNFAYNKILRIENKGALISSALTNCLTGALIAAGFGTVKGFVTDFFKRGAAANAAAAAGAAVPLGTLNEAGGLTAAAVAAIRA